MASSLASLKSGISDSVTKTVSSRHLSKISKGDEATSNLPIGSSNADSAHAEVCKSPSALHSILSQVSNANQSSAESRISQSADVSQRDELFKKVMTLMDSDNWRFKLFTKNTGTAVSSYHSPKGDTSPAAAIYAEVKDCYIYRAAITVKSSLEVLKKHKLNF